MKKGQSHKMGKTLANAVFNKGLVCRYIKNLDLHHNNNKKKFFLIGQKIWIDMSPKRTHKRFISSWQGTQHHQPTGKRKSKPQWNITWYPLLTIIKKSDNNRCWGECGEVGTFTHCWCKYKMVQLLWKTVCHFLKRWNIVLQHDSAIALLGIYPKGMKTWPHHNLYTDVHSCVSYNSQYVETTQMSINWWMDKSNVLYPYYGILLGNKRD